MKIQEMIDKVYRHLLTQNKKAINNNTLRGLPGCVYRASDGCKCAAGCLIPPEDYSPNMENKNVRVLNFFQDLSRTSEDAEKFLTILSNFQRIHDFDTISLWKENLDKVITAYHCSIPELTPTVSA